MGLLPSWNSRSKPKRCGLNRIDAPGALFALIRGSGYAGGYTRVTDFIRAWRAGAGKETKTFVPLKFHLGEAFQFDWSEGRLGGGGHLPLHAGLAYEAARQPGFLVGGPPQPRA